ncbi:unnamed protein product [Allacma fusca]|uniref:Uncharacterized protein n=1 Tax=Allacma fusca TaxID=39272 RepID=A0A8J2PMR2_9HEXA|nr:unnamed protein product [Allacma fusca]
MLSYIYVVSIIYLAVAFFLITTGKLRHVQDETQYRTIAKLNFDLIYTHYLNILLCATLAFGTYYFVDTTQRVFMIGWLIFRPILWVNSVRNFHMFLLRPHAYVLYDTANAEWRWQFISSQISYWITVIYWAFNVISWIYEWFIVIAFYYFISLKAPITTAVIPNSLHRIKDSALTEPCNPNKEFQLLCPTPPPWKNPNNKNVFYHPPLTVKTDNRVLRIP